jgi:hypothetical protein
MVTLLDLLKTCNSAPERREVIVAWKNRDLQDEVSCEPKADDPAVADILEEEDWELLDLSEYDQIV